MIYGTKYKVWLRRLLSSRFSGLRDDQKAPRKPSLQLPKHDDVAFIYTIFAGRRSLGFDNKICFPVALLMFGDYDYCFALVKVIIQQPMKIIRRVCCALLCGSRPTAAMRKKHDSPTSSRLVQVSTEYLHEARTSLLYHVYDTYIWCRLVCILLI